MSRSHSDRIKKFIQAEDPVGLARLLQNVNLNIRKWHLHIDEMLKETSSADLRSRLLDSLLSYGNPSKRRLLLDILCYDIGHPDNDDLPVGRHAASGEALSTAEATELTASRILEREPDLVTSMQNDFTVFHKAAVDGAESLVILAIKYAQVDLASTINHPDGNQRSALALAVDYNRVAIVRVLLDSVTSLNVEPGLVQSAVTLKQFQLASVIIKLRPYAMNRETVRLAVDEGQVDLLTLMLNSRPDLLGGSQLLHRAVSKRHVQVVKLLLEIRPELVTELAEAENPALASNIAVADEDPGVSKEIRSLIVPKIIRREKPPAIRKLVAVAWDQRKEICLDLRHFQRSDQDLTRFLKIIRSGVGSSQAPGASNPIFKVEFESTVRYVDIPIPDFPHRELGTGISPWLRAEARDILKWLKRSRGVDGIYQLSIRDSPYLPHSEDMISESLRGFDIESLDWKRADLSIDLIAECCPNLKTLHLYAGSWASLSYWTSKDGLYFEDAGRVRRFPKLKDVYIWIIQDIIGPSCALSYEKKAKAQIKSLDDKNPQRSWECHAEVKTWGSSKTAYRGRAPVKQVQTTAVEVTRLHAFLQGYGELQRRFVSKGWLEIRDPSLVKIAVIDDGIDQSSISCSQINGASFVYSDSGESPWWLSDDPHGTQMAKIITDIDPYCKLFIAKVGETKTDITRGRVIEAINWARGAKVDVITMSAALFAEDADLETEIKAAIGEGIVVISSMAGEGYNKREAYPAMYASVLGIAAANAQGKETLESVKEDADYLFQGENISTKVTYLGSENPQQEISGTSVATAIAAGVASLSLACYRLALSTESDNQSWEKHIKLRNTIVRNVFEKMTEDTKSKYVKPWKVFPETETNWSWGEAADVLDWIVKNFGKSHSISGR